MAKKTTKRKNTKKSNKPLLALIGLDVVILLGILFEIIIFGL